MRRRLYVTAALLAAFTATVCLRGGLVGRPLRMDNRIYFYISERAASGVPPHVSAPDVKTQLSTLVDAASISIGRMVGIDDVHAGRIGTLAILIAGIWGTGLAVSALGASPAASALGALSVLSFSGLAGHTAVGFNPKILLFTLMAWVPWLVARGFFFRAGAFASAAMLCWQPAAGLCIGVALGAVTSERRLKALPACIAGGIAAALAYEAYFAWHGVLDAQLFQSWVLPLGSVHDEPEWRKGIEFVFFGENHGLDHVGAAATCFALVVLGSLARLVRLPVPGPGGKDAPAPAVVTLITGGALACLFTAYDFQAEPDRFLLCAAFATSIGIVIDRVAQLVRASVSEAGASRLEGAVFAVLILCSSRGDGSGWEDKGTLTEQVDAGRVVAMLAETYGSVWTYWCPHLLGLAHLTNHHPVDHFWDDLEQVVSEEHFTPVSHGELPDVILRCRHLPGGDGLLASYVEIPLPGLEDEKVRAFVRTGAIQPPAE